MEQSPHRTRPPHLGARRVVPASREGRRAAARRLRHRLRRSRPALRRAARARRGAPAPRAALPPAPGRGAAAPGPPGLGRRSALQPALPPAPRRPARARQRGAAEEPRRPAVRPAPGPHEAAVGDLARRRPAGRSLRARRQEPPRARRRHRGRRHHDGALRPRARTPRSVAPPAAHAGRRSRCRAPPSCSATRCSSARPSPAELARTARAVVRTPRHLLQAGRDGLQAMGALAVRRHAPGAADAAERQGRPAPPLHLGRRRARRRCSASRTASAARSTTPCSRSSPARSGASCATAASRPRDWLLRALVPVLVRGSSHADALGNEVAPMWVQLPVGIEDPVRQHAAIRDATAGAEDSRAGGRRAHADRARRLRARRRS